MARKLRLDVPGYPQHVIQRGNNRGVCFFDDSDYMAYLEFLGLALHKAGCSLHAYVLMTNHVHLLVTGHHEGSIAVMMQSLGRRYVRYINLQYHRTGSLWEGRYRSSIIESDRYLLACYRYIEMNPVRAGLAKRPEHYFWSSYRHHANHRTDPLIEDHSLFMMLGETANQRAIRYRKLFEKQLDEQSLERIRASANSGRVLGSEKFDRQIRAALRRRSG
jgi:putative transposase